MLILDLNLISSIQDVINYTIPGVTQTSDFFNLFIFVIQWSAIVLSALAALVSARKHGLDFYGALVIVFIASNGGGTMRDVLLGRYPIFWIAQPVYALTPIVVVLLTILIGRRAKHGPVAAKIINPVKKVVSHDSPIFITFDTLALGLWAYLGTYFALTMGVAPIIAPIMGIITASFGGILRDLFFARVPHAFMPGQVYTAAALAGAIAYAAIYSSTQSHTLGFIVCFGLTLTLRVIAIKYNLQSH